MKKVKEVRQQILDICAQLKMRIATCGTDWDVCRQAVASAYFCNAAKMKTVAEYAAQFCAILRNSAQFCATL